MNGTKPDVRHPLLAQLATVPACQTAIGEADWFPPVDILEDANEYLFKIDLPEVKPEEVRVVVREDGLFISGERPKPDEPGKECLRIERPHGYFERRFALPEDASRLEIDSAFADSVLELHVRKVSHLKQSVTPNDRPSKLKLRSPHEDDPPQT